MVEAASAHFFAFLFFLSLAFLSRLRFSCVAPAVSAAGTSAAAPAASFFTFFFVSAFDTFSVASADVLFEFFRFLPASFVSLSCASSVCLTSSASVFYPLFFLSFFFLPSFDFFCFFSSPYLARAFSFLSSFAFCFAAFFF